MFDSCENCTFAEKYRSSRSVEELLERIKTLQEQIDKIEAEEAAQRVDPKSNFWSRLTYPKPTNVWDNRVVRLQSRLWEAELEIRQIRTKMECRRYPDPKEVAKSYKCGEYRKASR